jgi:hypothetical protein
VLVVGFSHGLFEVLQLPEADSIHTLSVSRERLSAAAFSAGGDWLALGCARLGQLLVWEWRSETYVLKQQVGGGRADGVSEGWRVMWPRPGAHAEAAGGRGRGGGAEARVVGQSARVLGPSPRSGWGK